MSELTPLEKRTYEQIAEENDQLRVDAEISKQEIIMLNAEIAKRDERESANSAGGVSARRLTDDALLEALRACELAYHRMASICTADTCKAFDNARREFWRTVGGEA